MSALIYKLLVLTDYLTSESMSTSDVYLWCYSTKYYILTLQVPWPRRPVRRPSPGYCSPIPYPFHPSRSPDSVSCRTRRMVRWWTISGPCSRWAIAGSSRALDTCVTPRLPHWSTRANISSTTGSTNLSTRTGSRMWSTVPSHIRIPLN